MEQIILRVGQALHRELSVPRSSEYAWEWSLQGNAKCVAIRRVIDCTRVAKTFGQPHGGHQAPRESIVIRGAAPGTVVVELCLCRPFEPPDAALRRESFRIVVWG
jgi:hypothetical protein